ncbi:SDR family NAD(P)-dependent oxidoreductase [Micromonospora sp. WMMD961]|uniref:SDR family NAD(P)-dependent oxidoreductase n=1 Tax=Micromonospora sp. WMMD961 TaxID=3016100 RepID=UPI002416D344|nr:SDR family NAD(P)-dependent oxidoreductase [Micromonospora sp. WMMD961]MDG4780071.1 SDR family NAD(P)-dependent oxidoreductase [Micromonospora sp. WMMD961]
MPETTRTALVTGATTGIGREVARRLAADGWRVLLHGRTAADASDALDGLAQDGTDPGRVETVSADFADLATVRDLAGVVSPIPGGLDLLVNNAALVGVARRAETVDGNEMSWQVNYVAHYLLTRLLMPALTRRPGARVVNLSSSLHRMGNLDWADLNRAARYAAVPAYAQSKLGMTMLATGLARHADADLTAVSVHPGVVRTRLMSTYSRSGAPVADGAEAVLHAVRMENPVNGGYYEGSLPAAPAPLAANPSAVQRLWRLTERSLDLEVLDRAA